MTRLSLSAVHYKQGKNFNMTTSSDSQRPNYEPSVDGIEQRATPTQPVATAAARCDRLRRSWRGARAGGSRGKGEERGGAGEEREEGYTVDKGYLTPADSTIGQTQRTPARARAVVSTFQALHRQLDRRDISPTFT